jgi:hypothetical protein
MKKLSAKPLETREMIPSSFSGMGFVQLRRLGTSWASKTNKAIRALHRMALFGTAAGFGSVLREYKMLKLNTRSRAIRNIFAPPRLPVVLWYPSVEYVQTLGKSVSNHWFGQGLVLENRYDRISTCRIASCESTRFIAGPFVPKLQRDWAFLFQRTNRPRQLVSENNSTSCARWTSYLRRLCLR